MVLGLRGFPGVEGGVETHAEHLYPLLAKLGCDIEVVVRKGYAHQERTWNGVSFYPLWAPKSSGLEALMHSLIGVLYAGLRRPDILHVHAIGPAIITPIARLLGLRVVITHHGPDYDRDKWGALARTVLRLGESLGMRFSHGRIAISRVIQDLIMEKYRMDSIVIPNGVNIADHPQGTEHLQNFKLTAHKYILQVSRLVPEKKQLDLIEAFGASGLDDWKLVFVGSAFGDTSYGRLITERAAQNERIVLTGFQTGESLRELYANAGLFVLPSSHEGLPIALLEAMSYGVPVLASDIAANREIGLPSDNYFPLGNITALQTQIRKLTLSGQRSRSDYRGMIRERYDWNQIANSTYKFYAELLSGTL